MERKIKSKADRDDTIFVTYALAANGMELCVMYILPSSEYHVRALQEYQSGKFKQHCSIVRFWMSTL